MRFKRPFVPFIPSWVRSSLTSFVRFSPLMRLWAPGEAGHPSHLLPPRRPHAAVPGCIHVPVRGLAQLWGVRHPMEGHDAMTYHSIRRSVNTPWCQENRTSRSSSQSVQHTNPSVLRAQEPAMGPAGSIEMVIDILGLSLERSRLSPRLFLAMARSRALVATAGKVSRLVATSSRPRTPTAAPRSARLLLRTAAVYHGGSWGRICSHRDADGAASPEAPLRDRTCQGVRFTVGAPAADNSSS